MMSDPISEQPPDPSTEPTRPSPEAEARDDRRQERGRRRAEHLIRWLQGLLRLPGWVRVPLLVLLAVLYSPPLIINLASVMNVVRTNRLRIYSYPQFVYMWPMIVWGLIFAGLVKLGVGEGFLAWAYMILFVYTAVAMGFDFKFGGWLGIIAVLIVVFVGLGWWGSARDIPVFQEIGDMLSGWLEFPTSWIATACVAMLVIFLIMMTLRRFNKRLRIHGNLVIVDTLLGKVDRNTRASYGINDDVPDVNELFLGLCSAFILEGKGTVASHHFKNVPGGPLVTRVIEEMLAATAIQDETDLHSEADEGSDDLAH